MCVLFVDLPLRSSKRVHTTLCTQQYNINSKEYLVGDGQCGGWAHFISSSLQRRPDRVISSVPTPSPRGRATHGGLLLVLVDGIGLLVVLRIVINSMKVHSSFEIEDYEDFVPKLY